MAADYRKYTLVNAINGEELYDHYVNKVLSKGDMLMGLEELKELIAGVTNNDPSYLMWMCDGKEVREDSNRR